MSQDKEFELYKAHREGQHKYAYFLLAAVGAAIAVAINQTQEAILGWPHLALSSAIISWGASFYYGCRYLETLHMLYENNYLYLRLKRMIDPREYGPRTRENAEQEAEKKMAIMETATDSAERYGDRQFWFLVAGAILFVVWHAWGMIERTIPHGGHFPI